MLKKAWKDPVWSAVIAASIIAIAGAAGSYFFGFWPAISRSLTSAWKFVIASSEVPNWLLAILILVAAFVLFIVLAIVWSWIRSESAGTNSTTTNWTSYTADMFFGLTWRWRYVSGRIDNLNTFCPNCDYQVFPSSVSSYNFIDRIAFTCDCCHRNLGEFNESALNLESKVERFIQQKYGTTLGKSQVAPNNSFRPTPLRGAA